MENTGQLPVFFSTIPGKKELLVHVQGGLWRNYKFLVVDLLLKKIAKNYLIRFCGLWFSPYYFVFILLQTVRHNAYAEDPYAKEFGIKISEKLASVEARVLPAPWVIGQI